MYGKTSAKKMIHVSQCCVLGRIVRIGGTLIDPSVWWEGFVGLEWGSVCTSYSRETAKQEVIYSWRSVLRCRAVSSCDATPSFPRKLWSPLWEEAGGRNTIMFSGFILPKDTATANRNVFCLNSPQSWGNQEVWENVGPEKYPCQNCCSEKGITLSGGAWPIDKGH